MRILELYSGIGGMHFALKESGVEGTIIAAVDINTVANSVYNHNFSATKILNRNIESMDFQELKKMKIDGILMSPPCQPFTRIGLQKDKNDARTCSLFQVLKIIKEFDDLKFILLENVVGFEKSETRNSLIETIQDKFNFKEFILSPCQFGIPNSRRRYYLIAKRKDFNFNFKDSTLIQSIPDEISEKILLPKKLINSKIIDIIENEENKNKMENYILSDEILKKRLNVLDIRSPDSTGSCCFTKAYYRYAEGTGSVYSPLDESTVKKLLEFIKNTEENEKKIELMKNLKLRYFTPKEVSRLMSFPENFTFPNSTTDKQKYRLLGNSINVKVVSYLIRILMDF